MSRSKSRHLADLIGSDGDVKEDKMDRAAKADMSNVTSLPAAVRAQLKGDTGATGPQGPAGADGATGPQGIQGPAGSNGSDAAFPSGLISMWSGSNGSIPSGWALCNGSNGTPDLRDRFVVGSGSNYATGNTGGANSVTPSGSVSTEISGSVSVNNHTLSESQMPSHRHTRTLWRGGGGGGGAYVDFSNSQTRYTGYAGGSQSHNHGTSHNLSSSSGFSGSSQDNRPSYYAIAFIMKL